MCEILNYYEVNPLTMALIACAHCDYQTIAMEEGTSYYVKKTPFQLIKEACIEGGASYEGRKIAVSHHTGTHHKAPIPINPHEQIYAFPTHSPQHFHCSWIFYNHIKKIKKQQLPVAETIIIFKNLQELQLPVSYYTLEKQLQRTALCIMRFSKRPTLQ